jgi:phospholipid-binding lipoprotein MlaA
MNPGRLAALLLAGTLALAGCATVPSDPAARAEFQANHDPLEPLNRRTFALNLFLDRILIKPIAQAYVHILPRPERDALRHFLDNLNEPVVFVNNLLQGRFQSAGITGRRFLLNSTAGIGGLTDQATGQHLPKQIGDFGQTLWAWGAKESPYLIVPLLGPTSPRDGIGLGADIYMDPFRYLARKGNYPGFVTVGRAVADGIDQRSRHIDDLDEMQKEAVDYYASFRSLYRQNREAELTSGSKTPPLPAADFYADPGH